MNKITCVIYRNIFHSYPDYLSEPEYFCSSGKNFFSLGSPTPLRGDRARRACGIFFKAIRVGMERITRKIIQTKLNLTSLSAEIGRWKAKQEKLSGLLSSFYMFLYKYGGVVVEKSVSEARLLGSFVIINLSNERKRAERQGAANRWSEPTPSFRDNNSAVFIHNVAFLVILIISFLAPPALAQEQKREEKFVVTWKSAAMAPSFYQGKILPTKYSNLKINFELIVNGVPVNLKNQEIQWFINHELKARGRGWQSLNLSPDALANRDILARIVVKNFHGRDLEEILTIPTARPETVIERLSDNLFRAWPFFFGAIAGKLNFSWEANGQPSLGGAAEPFLLELTIVGEPANAVAVQAVIQNQTNPLEMAKGVLMVKPL